MSNSIPLPLHSRTKPAKAEQPAKKPMPLIYKADGLWPWQNPALSRRDQYRFYMVSPFWRLRSLECKHMSGNACASCGKRNRLTVHHLTYERVFREPQSDLLCLCWKHHKQVEIWAKTLKTKPTREQILDNLGNPPFEPKRSLITFKRVEMKCAEAERLGFFHPEHTHL